MALAAGVDVTHLDSHMGTVLFPALPPHLREARRRVPPAGVRLPSRRRGARGARAEGLRPVPALAIEQLEAAGIPAFDDFAPTPSTSRLGEGLAHNRRRLARLGRGVSYLICHAAAGGEELSSVTPDSAHQRDFERSFYGGEVGRKELEAAGIQHRRDAGAPGARARRRIERGEGSMRFLAGLLLALGVLVPGGGGGGAAAELRLGGPLRRQGRVSTASTSTTRASPSRPGGSSSAVP